MTLEIDNYSIRARLYPSIIVMLPILVISVYYITDFEKYYHYLTAFCAFGLFTYVLSQLGRDKGKIKEPQLFKYFGGKPTTLILRHQNNYLDKTTKSRYHDILGAKNNIIMPTEIQEIQNPIEADNIYESCTKYIISKTRDTTKFSLLFKENIAYGFRRNLWGMKLWALVILVLCLFVHIIIATKSLNNFRIKSSDYGLGFIYLIFCLFWIFIVTKNWVKITAFAYAERLYESLNE